MNISAKFQLHSPMTSEEKIMIIEYIFFYLFFFFFFFFFFFGKFSLSVAMGTNRV